jgi:hypothetical protein
VFSIRFLLHVRRFRCLKPACPAVTFTEGLPALVTPGARRTVRLNIDDFSFRKGQVLGTILTDGESHMVVDLLPDRTWAIRRQASSSRGMYWHYCVSSN